MFATLLTLAALAGDPVAQPVSKPKIQLDPCSINAADASATLGADVDFRQLFSNGTGYASKAGCKRFVADFNVPSDANPADQHGVLEFDMGGGFATSPGTEASCNNTVLQVSTYEKAAGKTTFAKRSSATYKGQWSNGMFTFCNFVKTSGTNPPVDSPNAAGTEVWRVAVSATHNGVARPVVARIGFKIIPW